MPDHNYKRLLGSPECRSLDISSLSQCLLLPIYLINMYSACTQFSVIFEHVHTYMYVSDDIMATTGEFKIIV